MKNIVINTVIFAAGAAVGSVATWQIMKKHYENIVREEVESVKEVYARRNEIEAVCISAAEDAIKTITEETEENEDEDDYAALEAITVGQGYAAAEDARSDKPHVVSPYEFGEIEEYDKFTLTYYDDGFLTDENDCLIEDVESCIGFESLSHFGEYEDDAVFVRNDRLKCDYEVLRDQRAYRDVVNKKPYVLDSLEVEDE